MLRSVLAVLAGFVVIACLAFGSDAIVHSMFPEKFGPGNRVDDTGLLIVTEIYVFVYATFGCWLCARIARRRPMFHALILGGLGFAFNIIGVTMMWDTAPAWYHLTALFLVLPAAWLGGWIAERQMENRPAGLAGATA